LSNTNYNNNTVGQNNTVVGSPIHVGLEPYGIAFDSANGNLYVANQNTANFGPLTVSVIATTMRPTAITLNTITSVPWNQTITATGKLTDVSTSSSLGGATLTFTGTGAANLTNAVTASDGTFSTSGKAPIMVASGWTVQAHYAGGGIYGSSNSIIANYSTTNDPSLP
jgi:DNA-binding beta-propeller fold protein YncE